MIEFVASLLLAQAAAAQAAPPPPSCEGEAYRALDFWVGDWDVYPNGRETLVAHSKIEKLYNGCAIRENWMPLRGNGGGSLSGFDPATGRWHQTWIGSAPGVVGFEGGAVRQHGEFSADHGVTWQPSFDFIYRPHDSAGD